MQVTDSAALLARDLALGALDAVPDVAVLLVDRALVVVGAAGGALEQHGWERHSIVGRGIGEILDDPSAKRRIRSALAGRGGTFRFGDEPFERATAAPVRAPDGSVIACTLTFRSGTPGDDLLADAFRSAPAGLAVLDSEGRFLRVNARLCALAGRPAEDLAGRPLSDLIHPDDRLPEAGLGRESRAGRASVRDERLVLPDGTVTWIARRTAPIASRPGCFACVITDIGARKLAEAQGEALEARLGELAGSDPLTGLANRRGFGQELRVQLARSRRYGELAALLVIDLDRFKEVNDTLGHPAGDRLLLGVAEAMRRSTRETDFVARLGGDEFAVLAPRTDAEAAVLLSHKLLEGIAAAASETVPGVAVTASIGVMAITRDLPAGADPFALADAALYAAKDAGGGRVVVHQPGSG